MNFTIVGKNVTLTEGLKTAVEKKLGKLDKYFDPDTEIRATLGVQKTNQIVEVTIPFNGMILRAEESTGDMYSSIDNVVEKIEKQIIKTKTRLEKKVHAESVRLSGTPHYTDDDDEFKVVRTKRFAIKPMDIEEALLQMDMLGHSFFVFQNADTDEVNVVYKRKDGNYGLIEPEF